MKFAIVSILVLLNTCAAFAQRNDSSSDGVRMDGRACPQLAGDYMCAYDKDGQDNSGPKDYVVHIEQTKIAEGTKYTLNTFGGVVPEEFNADGSFVTDKEAEGQRAHAFCSADGMLIIEQVFVGSNLWTKDGVRDGNAFFSVLHYHYSLDSQKNLVWNTEALGNTSFKLKMKIASQTKICKRK